jgi:hypothetical protein
MITHYLQIPLFSTTKPSSKNFFTHIYLSSNNCHLHFDRLLKLELEAPAADLSMQQKQTLLQKKDLDPLNHRKSPARHMIAMKSLHMEEAKSPRIYEESIADQPSSSSSSLTSAPSSSAACLPKHLYILQQCISSQQKQKTKKPYQLTQRKKQNKTKQNKKNNMNKEEAQSKSNKDRE